VVLLVHRGVPAGPWGRERDLRHLYIRGASPEQAAEHVQTSYWNTRWFEMQAMIDELPFKVVRSNGHDEVLARATNLLIARAAYREAARLYPEDLMELRQGARIIERSR
jgi:hypothetical protein